MSNEIQDRILAQLTDAIRPMVSAVQHGAVEIETPFIDWKGCPVKIYVKASGRVTDGGGTLNELRSLRTLEKFNEWAFKENFYLRYGIKEEGDELEPVNRFLGLLSYIQGIQRIGYLFPPNPIRELETSDKANDDTPIIQLYSPYSYHGSAAIVLNETGRQKLIDALQNKEKVTIIDVFVEDGEGFDLGIFVLPESEIGEMQDPYQHDWGNASLKDPRTETDILREKIGRKKDKNHA